MEDEHIIYIGEENDKYPFICQYIVNVGSNNEAVDNNGIYHLIEHYLINSSYHNVYFQNVKIHGFTHFYFTCYYWYVSSLDEAQVSLQEFENVITEVKGNSDENAIFCASKKQILEEINYHTVKNDSLYKILLALELETNLLKLPIGNINAIGKIKHSDVFNYLESGYTSININRYIYDRKYDVFTFLEEIKQLDIVLSEIKVPYANKNSSVRYAMEKIKTSSYFHNLKGGSIKIIFKNIFGNSLTDIILGEIFLMQVCNYLKKTISFNTIRYEKFFISEDHIYFILSIDKIEPLQYEKLIKVNELIIFDILNKIITEDGFKNIINSIIDFMEDFNSSDVDESDFRMDLVNYSALSYPSTNLIKDKSKIIKKLKQIRYDQYCKYIYDRARLINGNDIKIIY